VRIKALLEQQRLAAALEELPAATIEAYDNLVGDLTAIDTAISDEDQALLLLTSLPSSYDNFVETLIYGRDTLKLEDVLATLNSRELQRDRGQVYKKNNSKIGVWLYVSDQKAFEQGLSQGDSYHITYMRDYLVDCERVCWWYVMELRRNLISLGTLEKEGFTVKMQSGKIKVIKGLQQQNRLVEETNVTLLAKDKIYAHESLTFNNTVACEVISKWKAGLKDDMDARSDVYVLTTVARNAVTTTMAITGSIHQATKGLLDKAMGNVLGMEIVKDQSEGSLSWDCDVEKNDKWSCIYAVGSQEYLMVCTRLDIAFKDVGMLDKFDCRLQTDVQVDDTRMCRKLKSYDAAHDGFVAN
ncbi:hypothetical protein Tco_0144899, partial [Tanacetum coccineum]